MDTRRGFMKTTVGSAMAIGLAANSIDAANDVQWRNRRDEMRYRKLGRTGFMVSEVVMGGNRITPDNYEHVLLAMDMGLNYLDTAPAYGQGKSEQGYARVIQARPRDQFFLNSKVSPWDDNRNTLYQKIYASLSEAEQQKLKRKADAEIERRAAAKDDYLVNYFGGQIVELESAALSNVMETEYGRRIDREKNYKQIILDSVDESLSRLKTDHLDLLMCPHGASSPQELLNFPEIYEAFEVLKKAGKVRHLGVSAHTDPAGILEAAVAAKVYSVAMVAYNAVNHAYVDQALARAHAAGLGVIAMKVVRPFYSGDIRNVDPKRLQLLDEVSPGDETIPQRAYLWALKNQHLSAVISDMVNADQVRANLVLPRSRKIDEP